MGPSVVPSTSAGLPSGCSTRRRYSSGGDADEHRRHEQDGRPAATGDGGDRYPVRDPRTPEQQKLDGRATRTQAVALDEQRTGGRFFPVATRRVLRRRDRSGREDVLRVEVLPGGGPRHQVAVVQGELIVRTGLDAGDPGPGRGGDGPGLRAGGARAARGGAVPEPGGRRRRAGRAGGAGARRGVPGLGRARDPAARDRQGQGRCGGQRRRRRTSGTSPAADGCTSR